MRHFELRDEGSSKFWEIEQRGSALHLRWGKVGTTGQSQEKSFADDAAAAKELAKLVAEKTKKGYAEVTPGGAPGSAPASVAPVASAPAPAPARPKSSAAAKPARSKPSGGWKPLTGTGNFVAAAPSGDFVVTGATPTKVGDAYVMAMTIHRKGGESITAPIPGSLGGLAVLPDGRIIATISQTHLSNTTSKDYAQAGVALFDVAGTLLGHLADPSLAGAGAIAVDPTGARIAFRATPREITHPRYLRTTLVDVDVDAVRSGGTVRHAIDFDTIEPLIDFGDDGTLHVIGTGRSLTIDPAGTVHEHPALAGALSATSIRPEQLGLSVAGTRRATIAHLDEVVVRDGDEVIFRLPEHVCTRAFLVEDGATLLTVAEAVKHRMGRAGEASVQWPDPEPLLRGDNIALWDIATGTLRRVLPRSAGTIRGVAPVRDQFVAVYTVGNKYKVDFFDWSTLFARE